MEVIPGCWRLMTPADISEVAAIAAVVHPAFFEETAVFAERQRLFPQGTLLLERAGRASGYVLSHPWRRGELPPLNSLLGRIPEDASNYYIHDLALLPEARGSRAAGALVDSLTALARKLGFPALSLAAVNGSRGFWERQGFRVVERPHLAAKLASYEAAAVLMEKTL